MPIKKIKLFLNSFILLILIFYLISVVLSDKLNLSGNVNDAHIFRTVFQKSFIGKIRVKVQDMNNDGYDEILVVKERGVLGKSKNDQLLYFSDIDSPPNIFILNGICRDFTVDDIYLRRPGKEIIILETSDSGLKAEIFGYAGQFIKRFKIFDKTSRISKTSILGILDWDNDGRLDLMMYIRKDFPDQVHYGIYAVSLGQNPGKVIWHRPIPYRSNINLYVDDLQGNGLKDRLFFIRPFWGDPIKNAELITYNHSGNLLWEKQLPGYRGFLKTFDMDPKIPGKEIVVSVSGALGAIAENYMMILQSQNGKLLKEQTFIDKLLAFAIYPTPKGPNCILFIRNGYYYILDRRLNVVKKQKFYAGYWKEIRKIDINNREAKEFLIIGSREVLLVTNAFKRITSVPTVINHVFTYYMSGQSKPMLLMATDGGKLYFLSYTVNLNYYLTRGKFIFLGILVLLVLFRLFATNVKEKTNGEWESLIGKFFTEQSRFATLVFSKSGQLIKYNSSAEKLIHLNFASYTGEHYHKFLNGELKSFIELLDEFFSEKIGNKSVSLSIKISHIEMNLQVDLHWINHPESSSDKIILMILQDMTELTRTHRLSAWISMAQRIAHDIKTPLSTVNLTAQRLEMALDSNEKPRPNEYKSYIRTMEEEIDRIRKITNGFLKFVRLEKLDFMPVNAN
ncbi:MAG TPA: hypothetical protein ENG82_06145, partial [Bacteroidetes bacterium]|nr:hypothetical protein [Bacteroidota bacterium]